MEQIGELRFTLPLPPSTNALYNRRRGGGLALSPFAKKFKEEVKGIISRHLSSVIRFPVEIDNVYELKIVLYFEALENPGWLEWWDRDHFYTKDSKYPKKHSKAGQVQYRKGTLKHRKGERKAKTRYKVIDVDNRVKFLQDCVTEGIGIPNDSQFFRGISEKGEDAKDPRAEVRVRVLSRDEFFKERR